MKCANYFGLLWQIINCLRYRFFYSHFMNNFFTATVRPVVDPARTERLADFGNYIAEVLPKYVQEVYI